LHCHLYAIIIPVMNDERHNPRFELFRESAVFQLKLLRGGDDITSATGVSLEERPSREIFLR
jgi:hypothetical protein